jgi:hypothetical protein
MGVALGAGITFMLRRGPSGRRPIAPALDGAGRGLKWAGKNAWKYGAQGARWTGDQAEDLWDRIPRDEMRRGVGRAMGSARDTMENMVESELRSMRKALRRKRKQLGI